MKHHLQATDDDYERAASASDRVDKAVQNPVQQAHALPRTALHGTGATLGEQPEFSDLHQKAAECNGPNSNLLGDTGLEPVTSRV